MFHMLLGNYVIVGMQTCSQVWYFYRPIKGTGHLLLEGGPGSKIGGRRKILEV